MSKLFKLKTWLTLPECAKRLSMTFEETVSEADVLRLALDGHLKLSVQLVNSAYARPCFPIKAEEIEWDEVQFPNLTGTGTIKLPKNGRVFSDKFGCFQVHKNITELDCEIWDIPMRGGERIDVEHAYQRLTNGPDVTAVSLDGVFLAGSTGRLYEVQSRYELTKEERLNRPFDDSRNFHPAGALPDDVVFVVRTDALAAFERSQNDNLTAIDKPLSTTERNTFLKLVIGMAVKGYSHDPTASKSTAPKEIADDLAGLGITVTDDTVRKYLKQAADAVLPAKPRHS